MAIVTRAILNTSVVAPGTARKNKSDYADEN
jgi:hypothetical protein